MSEPHTPLPERRLVTPLWLRLGPYDRKKNECLDLISLAAPEVASGWRVDGGDFNRENNEVRQLLLRSDRSEVHVTARKGYILAAGPFGTPAIISKLCPDRGPAQTFDIVEVPLVFEARPGISADSKNIHTVFSYIRFYLRRPSLLTQGVTDTLCVVPFTEGVISLAALPFGGYDRRLLHSGWSQPSETVFSDALTVLIRCHLPIPVGEEPSATAIKLLIDGIRLCRTIAAEPPLSHLLTGREALDVNCIDVGTPRGTMLRALYGKPPKRRSDEWEKQASALRVKAAGFADTEAYLHRYIAQHFRYAGFACGSLYNTSMPSNVRLGDVSGTDPETLRFVGGGGTVGEAIIRGRTAANHF